MKASNVTIGQVWKCSVTGQTLLYLVVRIEKRQLSTIDDYLMLGQDVAHLLRLTPSSSQKAGSIFEVHVTVMMSEHTRWNIWE